MIRRDTQSEIWIILQHDHALLAGEMLEAVGNGVFGAPVPFEAVLHAVGFHDVGWQARDLGCPHNPQGRPRHVFEISISFALGAWQDSVGAAIEFHPYSGLLVSLHAMHLAAAARAKEPADLFQLERFLQGQTEIQESMRTDLPLRGGLAEPGRADEEDLLLANFGLMRLMDQLSLDLCFDALMFDRVEGVYPRPMGEAVTFRIDRPKSGHFRMDPWPFAKSRLDLEIPAKRLPNKKYSGESEFAAVYAAAGVELLPVRLTNWHES
jgi:hypothetical protein